MKSILTSILTTILILIAVVIIGSVMSSYQASKLPKECFAEGQYDEVILEEDQYFILGGEPILWTGNSFQPGPGHQGEHFNVPMWIGDSTMFGQSEDDWDIYEWKVFACGDNQFSIWKTDELPSVLYQEVPALVKIID